MIQPRQVASNHLKGLLRNVIARQAVGVAGGGNGSWIQKVRAQAAQVGNGDVLRVDISAINRGVGHGIGVREGKGTVTSDRSI
jgi:hypothetical protein